MEKKRNKITPKQFLKYKSVTEFDENLIEIYIMILWKDKGKSFDQFAQYMFYDDLETFLKEIKDEYQIDFQNISEEEFLANIPEVYIEQFKAIREQIILMIDNNIELGEIRDSSEMEEWTDTIEEIRKEQIEKIATILSRWDLSEIPSEMLNDIEWVNQVNFENTGANIDMNNWSIRARYAGSFKGCNLISFNQSRYGQEISNRLGRTGMTKYFPADDDLEPEQYQVVINSYRGTTYLPSKCYKWFEEDEKLLANNTWFIEENIKNPNRNLYRLSDIWEILNDEYKQKYKQIFDLIIQESQKNSEKGLVYRALKVTPIELWEEYLPKIEEILTNDKGKIDVTDFLKDVWKGLPKEIQERYFDYFVEKVNNEEIYTERDCLGILYGGLNQEQLNERLPDLFKKYINLEDNIVTSENFWVLTDILKSVSSDVEYPEEVMTIIFNTYKNRENACYRNNLKNIWSHVGKENQLKYMQKLISLQKEMGATTNEMAMIWESTNIDIRFEQFQDIIKFLEENELDEFNHFIQGEGYINIIKGFGEKGIEVVESNMSQFLYSLREKYGCNIEGLDISKDTEYEVEYAKVLLELDQKKGLSQENLNTIIRNMPKLGIDLINRIYSSNSKMLANYGNQLIEKISTLPREEATRVVEEVEHVFSQNQLPEFIKLYKYYELVHDVEKGNLTKFAVNDKGRMSPVIANCPSEKVAKRVIFSDLMKIAMDTNNKSMRKFLSVLSEGNEIYINLLKNEGDISKISSEEYQELQNYVKTLYSLYENSGVATVDKSKGKKIFLSGEITQDLQLLAKRYTNTEKVTNLPDLILKTYIGPYEELYGGITTVKQMQEYMDSRVNESNDYHRQLAKKEVKLEPGDMVKGVQGHTDLLQEIFGNGIRAGEFLGEDSHTDATPLDTDFSIITTTNTGTTLNEKISKTNASSYGRMYVILKNDPTRVEFTRSNSEAIQVAERSAADKMSSLTSSEEILRRVTTRSNGEYETKKIEAFHTGVLGEDHYGVRTGLGITDIDYIVVRKWDKRIGYELAMNGTYIPVYDIETQEILFTPEMYDEIRDKMQGLSYYGTGQFKVDSSAYSSKTKEIIQKLFPDGNPENSISQKDAQGKRSSIEKKVVEVLRENFGIDVETYLTGDLTNGFVEFIDTGSTGRGTNLPGDGDFDFTMKIDKAIMDNREAYSLFTGALRTALAVKSNHPESSLEEANGNFRYKKVQVEGVETPLDIDITFMKKNGEIEYSTDMAVRERLDGLKKSDPEGYKVTIANIVLAKKMLKEAGLYKKESSPGASEFGGFGGVGVENWILQNGGSFVKAMETFLEASKRAGNFKEFQEIYPIFDFGQNHMAKGYSHDSFIRGLTSEGYIKMQEKFKEFQEQIKPAPKETIQEIVEPDLTFAQIGKGTLDSFRQEPGEAIAAGETLERGVKVQEELKKGNVQGGN